MSGPTLIQVPYHLGREGVVLGAGPEPLAKAIGGESMGGERAEPRSNEIAEPPSSERMKLSESLGLIHRLCVSPCCVGTSSQSTIAMRGRRRPPENCSQQSSSAWSTLWRAGMGRTSHSFTKRRIAGIA